MTNVEFATSLREMADFYEATPDAPVPYRTSHVFTYSREEFLRGVTALARGGKLQKTADDPDTTWPRYKATRQFGHLAVEISIDRSLLCRLVHAAVYECPDSLLEEAAEFTQEPTE